MTDKEHLILHLRNEGFSEKIISAFQNIERESFITDKYKCLAYHDIALPLDKGSTISQPSTIAFMLELLDLQENISVLEIGSGCGYVIALIRKIINSSKIYGIEINKKIFNRSIINLKDFSNIKLFCQDGKNGLPEYSSFDRILISAACEHAPYYLLKQLNESGIIVTSVKNSILKIQKTGNNYSEEEFYGFSFVPLI